MSDNVAEKEVARWYAIHTYSGYENKVKANIEKSVENRGIQHLIQKVEVLEEVVDEDGNVVKNKRGNNEADSSAEKGAKPKRVTKRKLLPCYVLVKMIKTDESWFVVRNTRGVTGFVGPASEPTPISDEEVMKLRIEKTCEFEVGDYVVINSEMLEDLDGFEGVIESIDESANRVSLRVNQFGREVKAEVDINCISYPD